MDFKTVSLTEDPFHFWNLDKLPRYVTGNFSGEWVTRPQEKVLGYLHDSCYIFAIHDEEYTKFVMTDENGKNISRKYTTGHIELTCENVVQEFHKSNIISCGERYIVSDFRKNCPKHTVFMFWTGKNEMSANRKNNMRQFMRTSDTNVILITCDNLDDYILKEHPLHPAYEHLSETHKADYLRTYFMNFYGGGYSDVKGTVGSWTKPFETLMSDDNVWIVGYPEKKPGDIAGGPEIRAKWMKLVGNCAYICRRQSPLTNKWYNEMISLLNSKLERLLVFPARYPQDCSESSHGKYPIEWNEMLGRIFHRLCAECTEHINNSLPWVVLNNYR